MTQPNPIDLYSWPTQTGWKIIAMRDGTGRPRNAKRRADMAGEHASAAAARRTLFGRRARSGGAA